LLLGLEVLQAYNFLGVLQFYRFFFRGFTSIPLFEGFTGIPRDIHLWGSVLKALSPVKIPKSRNLPSLVS
jgi:hypothetical protein